MRRVDFFIAGVQKGGTTALDAYLRRAAEVQMADVKEVHHFDDESLDWSHPDPEALHRHFDWSRPGVAVRGEATPITMYWPNAVERLARYNPGARLIVCLRHPAFRAYSHWRMETTRAADTFPFEVAIAPDVRRLRVGEAPGGVHRVFSYVERGFYAPQIRRLRATFPPEQLLFLRTDNLWMRPEPTLRSVHRLLGIAPPGPLERRYIVPLRSSEEGFLPDASRMLLTSLFAADIAQTATLTGLDLADWLDPDYREPMAPAPDM